MTVQTQGVDWSIARGFAESFPPVVLELASIGLPSMLVIRKEQMELLGLAATKRFAYQASTRLRELFPEAPLALCPPQLHAWVLDGIEIARNYEIRREVDVQAFLELRLHLDEDLLASERLAWVRAFLARTDFTPRANLDDVYAEVLLRHDRSSHA